MFSRLTHSVSGLAARAVALVSSSSTVPVPLNIAAARAADWLEANPQKHTTGRLAGVVGSSKEYSPSDPKAECFCALGRLLKERGVTYRNPNAAYDASDRLFAPKLTPDDITIRNDFDKKDGIEALREIANG